MFDLRHLNHLVALADECHFARAAERVNLSQSAFSRSIQATESMVGMRLFERETGPVKPTPAGAFLIERARRLLFDARCLQRDIELYRQISLGDTSFGAGPLPAATLIPEVLATLRQEHPEIEFRIEVNNWRVLLEHLRTEDIEYMVCDVRELPADAALEIRSIGRQSGGLFVRREHPLARGKHILTEVWSFGVASVRFPEAVKRGLGVALGLALGKSATLALESDDVGLLKTLALRTNTVLALTDVAVRTELDSGELVPLQVPDLPPLYSEMGLARLRNRTPSPAAQKVVALIEARAARINLAVI